MEEGIKRTYYITDKLDMALKIRAVQDHMTYSEVVTAALERYHRRPLRLRGHFLNHLLLQPTLPL